MPIIDVDSLRKILELEQKKGYSDSTVIGGLDKFHAAVGREGNRRELPTVPSWQNSRNCIYERASMLPWR